MKFEDENKIDELPNCAENKKSWIVPRCESIAVFEMTKSGTQNNIPESLDGLVTSS